jgi:hypothetical protein
MAAHRNCALCPVGGRRRLLGVEAGDGPYLEGLFCLLRRHSNDARELLGIPQSAAGGRGHYKWKVAALTGLAPIPIPWLLVYGLIGLVRWIRQGFKAT